ncbi:MAG TPA: sigma-54 dependent transcriptional regulator [Planctomycetota bacterium]
MVLVAEDDPVSRRLLQEAMQSLGHEVHAVEDGQQAIAALEQREFDLIVTDLQMPNADGMQVLEASKQSCAERPVVVVTAHGTMHGAVQALRRGADDILEKPVVLDELEVLLARVADRRRLLRQNSFLRAEATGGDLIVASRAMQAVVAHVWRVARSRIPVLVSGECGTGKDRVAAMVHRCSDRAQGPFVKLDCSAMPEAQLEIELFGSDAASPATARTRREGRLELADAGTLFLDEVGAMSPGLQARLLRVLQEGQLERVGGKRAVRADVRVVAATTRSLETEVGCGRFLGDLLKCFDTTPIAVPPLRERTDEIVPLARHFLRAGCEFDESAVAALQAWSWPGNVSELQSVVQRVGLASDDGVVTGDMVWRGIHPTTEPESARGPVLQPADPYTALLGRPMAEIERELVRRTLAFCAGNRTRTAAMLGIGVRTLFNKLQDPTPPLVGS